MRLSRNTIVVALIALACYLAVPMLDVSSRPVFAHIALSLLGVALLMAIILIGRAYRRDGPGEPGKRWHTLLFVASILLTVLGTACAIGHWSIVQVLFLGEPSRRGSYLGALPWFDYARLFLGTAGALAALDLLVWFGRPLALWHRQQ